MDFRTYWQSLDAEGKKKLAEACGTSVAYLSQLAHGHRRASHVMAQSLERLTAGRVSRGALRPDIYPAEAAHA